MISFDGASSSDVLATTLDMNLDSPPKIELPFRSDVLQIWLSLQTGLIKAMAKPSGTTGVDIAELYAFADQFDCPMLLTTAEKWLESFAEMPHSSSETLTARDVLAVFSLATKYDKQDLAACVLANFYDVKNVFEGPVGIIGGDRNYRCLDPLGMNEEAFSAIRPRYMVGLMRISPFSRSNELTPFGGRLNVSFKFEQVVEREESECTEPSELSDREKS